MDRFATVGSQDAHVRALIGSARHAAESGLSFEAQQFLRQAQSVAPRHPLVLTETAKSLLHAGRASEANKLLGEALRAEPANADILFASAVAHRAQKRTDEALRALENVLAIEPGNMAARFEKASIEEQRGDERAAVMTYSSTIRLLPENFQPPKWMEGPLAHARERVDANFRALETHIDQRLAPLRQTLTGERLDRFDRCVDTLLQKRKIVRQQPSFMFFPELPAIPFHNRTDFPWLDDLEAAADEIRAELVAVLDAEGQSALDPYVADQPGLDVQYYKKLNRSRRWGVYPLWREGRAFPERIARCPRTVAALARWPKWDVPGDGPTALFSLLAPKTHIPPHSGPVNTRLLAHLGLIIPDGCGLRVGGIAQEWQPGKAFVFDDSIRHEAWNDSNEMRAVLIVDMWNPALSVAERDLVRALTTLLHEWYGAAAAGDLHS